MLVILYIASIVASFLAPIFDDRDEEKNFLTSVLIALVSGMLYCIPTIIRISTNLFNPSFINIFGLLSLIFLDYTFLIDDRENCFNYIVCAFLGSSVICFVLSNFYFTDYLVYCNENHDYTEHVEIVTTVDGSSTGESIFGNGYTIGLLSSQHPKTRLYQYYYKIEDGNIINVKVFEKRVTITYIDEKIKPYVEIHYKVNCIGQRNKSKVHVFRGKQRTYHFYIPENSIADITSTN